MDRFLEDIKIKIAEDKKKVAAKFNVEDLYIIELASKWIEINVSNEKEFEDKIQSLGRILNDRDFQEAVRISNFELEQNNDNANQIVELIRKIKTKESYKEDSKISGYKLLDKYEDPSTYKTDAFIVHVNIVKKMYSYLNEIIDREITL